MYLSTVTLPEILPLTVWGATEAVFVAFECYAKLEVSGLNVGVAFKIPEAGLT